MTLVVKLGSSVVASDRGVFRGSVLDSICEQVSRLMIRKEPVVIVSSGAVVRGARLSARPHWPRTMDELQAASAVGQGDVFRAYEKRLKKNGTKAAQILLTRSDITNRDHYRNARQTMQRLLSWGIVPVVNENDTTATDEISFGDNDFLAAQIAVFLHARMLILLTNTDGLYRSDPRIDPEARMIRQVKDFRDLAQIEIGLTPSAIGRGGMASKIAAAEMATQGDVTVVIGNGQRPGVLADIAKGKAIGTRFPPTKGRKRSVFKLWLEHAGEAAGTITVDDGAAKNLRASGSSLLAVGVVGIKGKFDAGELVDVRTERGDLIGRGIVEISAPSLRRIKGRRSAEAKERVRSAPDEVIHRDRFVLL
jgi:glutamate 5-kinase